MTKTGWPMPPLMQDDNPQLSRWFATRPDARYFFKRNIQMSRQEAILELTRYELQYLVDNAESNTDLLEGNAKFFASGGFHNWTDGQLAEKMKLNNGDDE